MDASIASAVKSWLDEPAIAEADKKEIRELQAAGSERELTDRFYRELEFGTAGLRGIIGAGLNRMNIYTVGAAAQGLANYIAQQGEAARRAGVAIACDSRRKSDVFAERTAAVLAGNGITAYLFEALRPTPELSYAVRHLNCTAGVVVTASHNPPAYNGFKVYWTGGVPIVPPHDKRISEEVRRVGGFGNIKVMPVAEAKAKGLIRVIGREVDEAFLAEVHASCLSPEISRQQGKNLKIVYTPLHGTGITLVPEALKRRGFEKVIVVPEQGKPDGEFPTVEYPNPEEGAALTLGIELAKREGADLVIGTDPDADRVGVAVRGPGNQFELITGNQIAAMLTWHICETLTRSGRFPKNAAMITTIVSGDMMKDIARSYGAEVIEVLTGFKWIGDQVMQFDAAGSPGKPSKTYIFGAEESYGYMPCTYTRDKDAVTSTAYVADLAAVAAAQGKTLYDLLLDLYRRYGYYQEGAKSLTLPGKDGADRIKAMMQKLRTRPPERVAGVPVRTVADLATGEIRDARTGKVVGQYNLPPSDVVFLTLDDGTKAIARPSGTEPKIKFYVLTKGPGDNIAQARENATAKIQAVIADVAK
ncbi:MAG TPA: phospho-sugar mutase [Phycisphaerae bacterium]|nr:phospho-sugar mutase [Phycisphaerae bacterium]HRY68671.1 phospho-sugar mutase [Phycisphaerae bacterium]HSA25497.1 phospho-sugar mutase [Phycisphaerae bacterium]